MGTAACVVAAIAMAVPTAVAQARFHAPGVPTVPAPPPPAPPTGDAIGSGSGGSSDAGGTAGGGTSGGGTTTSGSGDTPSGDAGSTGSSGDGSTGTSGDASTGDAGAGNSSGNGDGGSTSAGGDTTSTPVDTGAGTPAPADPAAGTPAPAADDGADLAGDDLDLGDDDADDVPLAITVAGLKRGAAVKGATKLTVRGNYDLDRVQLRIDGRLVATLRTAPWALRLDPRHLKPGHHVATVAALSGDEVVTQRIAFTVPGRSHH